MDQNPVKSYHQKTDEIGGDAMINTNDLKTINTNLDKQFDVIIFEKDSENDDEKPSWFIQIHLHHKSDYQELHTFTGHRRYFKTLDFCLRFVHETCNNAQNVFIVCNALDGQKIEVFSNLDEFNQRREGR